MKSAKKLVTVVATLAILFLGIGTASAFSLTGTIRDFCAPGIENCTQLSDFEGAITGLTTGMVSSTLTAGLPTYIASNGYGATTADNFAKWYVDSPGYNVSTPFSLTLTETMPDSGIFSYSSSAFFPIDGQLYGNQGRSHNYHFTMHLEGLTSFKAADTFYFYGDDDLWIYVDGKLAMDLGGVHAGIGQTITGADLIALGLSENTLYDFDVFFAERHTSESNFNITTSFRMQEVTVPEPATMLLLGLGLLGLAGIRRKLS
jgi:fibro-slime domain-containing protein